MVCAKVDELLQKSRYHQFLDTSDAHSYLPSVCLETDPELDVSSVKVRSLVSGVELLLDDSWLDETLLATIVVSLGSGVSTSGKESASSKRPDMACSYSLAAVFSSMIVIGVLVFSDVVGSCRLVGLVVVLLICVDAEESELLMMLSSVSSSNNL